MSITGTADGFYIGCNILDEDDIYITNLQVLTEQEVLPTGYLVHAMYTGTSEEINNVKYKVCTALYSPWVTLL